jgi:hypothetical protein
MTLPHPSELGPQVNPRSAHVFGTHLFVLAATPLSRLIWMPVPSNDASPPLSPEPAPPHEMTERKVAPTRANAQNPLLPMVQHYINATPTQEARKVREAFNGRRALLSWGRVCPSR